MTEALTDHAVEFVAEAAKADKPFFLYAAYLDPHAPLHAREEEIAPHRSRYREAGWEQCRDDRIARQRKAGLTPATWTPTPFARRGARLEGRSRIRTGKRSEWRSTRRWSPGSTLPSGGLSRPSARPGPRRTRSCCSSRTTAPWRPAGSSRRPADSASSHTCRTTTGGSTACRSGPAAGRTVMPGPADTYAAYGEAWAHVGNAPFRGAKFTAYEGGIRTPLIARWPSVIEPGGLTSDIGHIMDLLPTCLDVAGAEYPAELDGRKPLPVEGQSLAPSVPRRVTSRARRTLLGRPQEPCRPPRPVETR